MSIPLFRLATEQEKAAPPQERQRLAELVAEKTDELARALSTYTAPPWEAIIPAVTPDNDGLALAQRLADISATSLPSRIVQSLIAEVGKGLAQYQIDRLMTPQVRSGAVTASFAATDWLELGADALLRGDLSPEDALYEALNNQRTVGKVLAELERIIAEKLSITQAAATILIQRALLTLETPILTAIREAMRSQLQRIFDRARDEGMTLKEFRDEAVAVLPAATDANLETEFRTGLAEEHGRAAYEFAQRNSARIPYMQWLAIGDDRTRATHRVMHHVVAATDSQTWVTWRVPAGYNCRCVLSPIPYTEALRRGWAKREGNRLVITGGEYPLGKPPAYVYDPKRKKVVAVRPDPGFEGGVSAAA